MHAFLENRLQGEKFRVWQMSYYGLNYMAHWHREIELLYVKNGSAELSLNNETFVVGEGDLFICKSGEIHQCKSDNSSLATVILVNPDILGSLNKAYLKLPNLIHSNEIDEKNIRGIMDNSFDIVRNELLYKEAYFENVIKAAFVNLFAALVRNFKDENLKVKDVSFEKLSDLQTLLDYIVANYDKNISLEEASELMHFSPCYFSKMFKKLTNMNYVAYCNTVKIEKASELLLGTGESIEAVAKRCGFKNIRSFNRVFLNYAGTTPSQYRKSGQHKNKPNTAEPIQPRLALTSYAGEFY